MPAAADMQPILYNYDAKKTVLFRQWSVKRPQHHLQFIPNSARGVHVTERSFALLTQRQLGRRMHRSTWKLGTVVLGFRE